MAFNRIVGSLLVLSGIFGYTTVADDLRHGGELVGVTAILLAGFILLAASLKLPLLRFLPVRWMAFGILFGMILGAGLDNMAPGITIGFTIGTAVGLMLARKNRSGI